MQRYNNFAIFTNFSTAKSVVFCFESIKLTSSLSIAQTGLVLHSLIVIIVIVIIVIVMIVIKDSHIKKGMHFVHTLCKMLVVLL